MISVVCAVRDLKVQDEVIKNMGENKPSQIIFVQGRNPSYQRNAGVKEASGDIVYFMDDDSVLPAGLLNRAESYLSANPEAAVLGGPELTPQTDTIIQKSFGAVFASFFASGKSSLRYKSSGVIRKSSEKEIILCNMFVRKTVFEELKGFDERLYPNEENEFLNRVKENKGVIIHDPGLFIYRSKRKDYPGFIRQCFNYGRGRTEQSFVNFSLSDLVNFVPAFFLIYLLSELATGCMDLMPLAAYAVINIFFSVKIAAALKSPQAGLLSFLNFFLVHICYGAGTLYGFVTSFTLKDRQTDTKIQIKKTGFQK